MIPSKWFFLVAQRGYLQRRLWHPLLPTPRGETAWMWTPPSCCTQPFNIGGGGAVGAAGGFLYIESECEAQSSWSSSWRHIKSMFIKHSVAVNMLVRPVLMAPESAAFSLTSYSRWSPPDADSAPPASSSLLLTIGTSSIRALTSSQLPSSVCR